MNANEMIRGLRAALEPLYGRYVFKVDLGGNLGDTDSVHVTLATVPKGSPEIDCTNAKARIMVSIAGADHAMNGWVRGGDAPSELTVSQFRGGPLKLRKKTGAPDVVVEYLIKWFVKNKSEFDKYATE
jgi:hypothetical protein